MKDYKNCLVIILSIIFCLNLSIFSYATKFVSNSNYYKDISDKNTIIFDDYRLKYDYKNGIFKMIDLYKGNSKNSYLQIKNVYDFLLTCENIYYFSPSKDNKYLIITQEDLKSKKTRQVLKMKAGIEPYQMISLKGIIDKNLYFTKSHYSIDKSDEPLYSLDLDSKKYKKIFDNFLGGEFGENKIFYNKNMNFANDTSAYSLFECDKNGKNEKEILRNVKKYRFIDERLYYVQKLSNDKEENECILYIMDEGGKNKKALTKKFKCSKVIEIDKNNMIYTYGNAGKRKYYKMNLETGEIIQIKDPYLNN